MKLHWWINGIVLFAVVWAVQSNDLTNLPGPGEKWDLAIPLELKADGTLEGYFYTHGPISVYAYENNCVVTVRNPLAPDSPVAVGTAHSYSPFHTTLTAGFYYISVTKEAGILVGVNSSNGCNGYYLYRSTGAAYENNPFASTMQGYMTGSCNNAVYIFSPGGASSGFVQLDPIESIFENFDLTDSNDYHIMSRGTNSWIKAVVSGGEDLLMLERDGTGYSVPPYTKTGWTNAYHYTYCGMNEELTIHCFADNTPIVVWSLGRTPISSLWSGTLNAGETQKIITPIPIVTKVQAPRSTVSVSVKPGNTSSDQSYMDFLLDSAGNMQGSDFITEIKTGDVLMAIGLQDDTAGTIRSAETGELASTFTLNAGQVQSLNPGTDIWRIQSNHDITLQQLNGKGACFVPLTRNLSGSSPFPPVVAGVSWWPYAPLTSDNNLTVSYLTDEPCYSKVHYRFGSGAWQVTPESSLQTEHAQTINISALDSRTVVEFHVEARDQSGQIGYGYNDGANFTVTVEQDVPNLSAYVSRVDDMGRSFRIHMRIWNSGNGVARNVRLSLLLEGMQPFSDNVTCNYSGVDMNQIWANITIPEILAEDSSYLHLDVMPYFSHTSDPDYRIVSTSLQTEDSRGRLFNGDVTGVSHNWDDTNIESRYNNVDYVILANPQRFFWINNESEPSAQQVPVSTVRFALYRDAALAYISSGDVYQIRSYIQSRFNYKVNSSWLSGGYLLLVGCPSVVPSFTWSLGCSFTDDLIVHVADNTYANIDNDGKFTPELCLGRITGDHPDTYNSVLDRSVTAPIFEKAISVSGTGGGESTFYNNAVECRDRLTVIYPQTPATFRLQDYAAVDRTNVYLNNEHDVDFLYYRDHGNVPSWDSFDTGTVPSTNFNGKFPIIYSNACLTGAIHRTNNLAEAFLAHAASLFIGATEVSPRSPNNKLGNKITARHRDGSTIGQAFRNGKRSLAGDIHWYTTCYQDRPIKSELLMYNIYGDPKRGGGARKDWSGEKMDLLSPDGTAEITIPMYEVENWSDGTTNVVLPDDEHGDQLALVNEPLVPIYRWSTVLEPGVRVNAIEMVQRENMSSQSGLNLPLAWGNQKTEPGPDDQPSPGVFPSDDYHWTTFENPDGRQEVMLTVHPFFYNAETGDATFYQTYTFQFQLSESAVEIRSVTPAYEVLPVDVDQSFEVVLFNGGEQAEEITLELDIIDIGNSESITTIQQKGINLPGGETLSHQLNWQPNGADAIQYQAIVRAIRTQTEDECDVAYSRFRLGNPELVIDLFSFDSDSSGYIQDGEVVPITFGVASTGDIPADATMLIEIRQEETNLVIASWEQGVTALPPGESKEFKVDWDSSGIEDGQYWAMGSVISEKGVEVSYYAWFRTLCDMRFGWSLPGDIFRPGEKVMATGNLYNEEGLTIGFAQSAQVAVMWSFFEGFDPELRQHSIIPFYSTSFVLNPGGPNGLYFMAATASTAGYRDTTDYFWFCVSEQGFACNATPAICPADGNSVVTVVSDEVFEEGELIPDGTLMTVQTSVGTILNEDADPESSGLQVASTEGRFEIEWRAPNVPQERGFLYGSLGTDRPMTGLSVNFVDVDYNRNQSVDVGDILRVGLLDGELFGSASYRSRLDLNRDQRIDAVDREILTSHWPIRWNSTKAEADSTGSARGVILRPQPQTATVTPGSLLDIEIVLEGSTNLGGVEFGYRLSGDAMQLVDQPVWEPIFAGSGNTQEILGPVSDGTSSWIGTYALGGHRGPSGATTVLRLRLQADQIGETELDLSDLLVGRVDGSLAGVLSVQDGLYTVALATPTPTYSPLPTNTSTPAPTYSATPIPTDTSAPTATALPPTVPPTAPPTETVLPTATGTASATATLTATVTITPTAETTPIPGDTNGDGRVDFADVFYFSRYWQESSDQADPSCNPVTEPPLFVNQRDLLDLLRYWQN